MFHHRIATLTIYHEKIAKMLISHDFHWKAKKNFYKYNSTYLFEQAWPEIHNLFSLIGIGTDCDISNYTCIPRFQVQKFINSI